MDQSLLGRVAYSKVGRDKDKYFVIVGILNEEYVYISNGDLRKIETPKKKKIKHLHIANIISEKIQQALLSGNKVSNSEIKKFLQSIDINKEVCLPYVKR